MVLQPTHRATVAEVIEEGSANHCSAVSAQFENRSGPRWCHKLLEGNIMVVFPIESTFLGGRRVVISVKSSEFVSQNTELKFILHMWEDWSGIIMRGGAKGVRVQR